MAGRKKCIQLVMDKGADPTIRDMRGALAYEYCDDDELRVIMGGMPKADDPNADKFGPPKKDSEKTPVTVCY